MTKEGWENDLDRRVSEVEADAANGYNRRASNEVERVLSASSASTATSQGSLRDRPHHGPSNDQHSNAQAGMSRVSTQRDHERHHHDDLDRIQTARSQHSATVGSTHLGRSSTRARDSRKPLPPMGAGKPMPPALDADEYVVEFDGPDDPLNALNWPLRKK